MLSIFGRLALAAGVLCAGCSNPLNPEALFAYPEDSGTVTIGITDTAGVAVSGVLVMVRDIPNKVGSFYSIGQTTNARGTVTFPGIPTGARRIEVTPPAGFSAGPEGAIKPVQILKGGSVAVAFVLAGNP
jgi:hypothetical protein